VRGLLHAIPIMKRSRARAKDAIEFAKSQRASANDFADTLWQWLRNRQCCDQKFRREYPIPPYTVDGASHLSDAGIEHDQARDRFLNRLGYCVVRIPGYDVIRDGRAVIERVERAIKELASNPSPPASAPADLQPLP
jgi:very-short-patch-repair endonuclease